MTSNSIGIFAQTLVTGWALLSIQEVFAIPPWARTNTVERTSTTLKLVCQGEGPSIDLARKSAILQCKGSAGDQLQSEVSIKTINIESERNVSSFQEVSSHQHFSGLVCKTKKEEIEETSNGLIRSYVLCEFDLSKVKLSSAKELEQEEDRAVESERKAERSISAANKNLSQVKSQGPAPKVVQYTASSTTSIYLESVPMCSMLIIRGGKPRSVKCSGNPQPVLIESGDEEIIVQADGHIAKTVNVKNTRKENGESIRVILDSN